jgi:hypothetical protein
MPGLIRVAVTSPTMNTWASLLARTGGSLLLLTVALGRLPVEEFNVWAMFAGLAGLQLLVDMGFCVTFVRAIAMSLAGVRTPESFRRHARVVGEDAPNWALVERVAGFMRWIYARLGWIYLAVVGIGGTWALMRPVSTMQNSQDAWVAWSLVLVSSTAVLRGSYAGVLLQGLNEVVLFRRWEAIMSLGSSLSGCVVLYYGGSLLMLVAVTQVWSLAGILRYRSLCLNLCAGKVDGLPRAWGDHELLTILWPATWRSGVGVMMSFGLVQLTGLLQAQFVPAAASASYLLCMRFVQQISAFSQAPFYSKLPLLSRLRAENRITDLVEVAGRGMRWSLWAYAAGYAAAGSLGSVLLEMVGSKVAFPSPLVWTLFGTVFGVERYAAMHLNLYNTTNDVITHIANGVTGILCVVFVLILFPFCGALALPLGLLSGYLGFYAWYPVVRTYDEFGMHFWSFELRNSAGPLALFLAATAFVWLLGN